MIILPLVCDSNVSQVQAVQELVAAQSAANNIEMRIPVIRGNRKNRKICINTTCL